MRRTSPVLLVLVVACTRGAPVPDDSPPATTASATIPSAAVSASLLPGPAASSAVAAAPSPSLMARNPGLREDVPTLSNPGLPPLVVRRIVRQNFGHLRLCYQAAGDPTLEGALVVKFRIDTSGAVSTAVDAGSTLGNADLVACATKTFLRLAFPSPTAGPVDVTYTVHFSAPYP